MINSGMTFLEIREVCAELGGSRYLHPPGVETSEQVKTFHLIAILAERCKELQHLIEQSQSVKPTDKPSDKEIYIEYIHYVKNRLQCSAAIRRIAEKYNIGADEVKDSIIKGLFED